MHAGYEETGEKGSAQEREVGSPRTLLSELKAAKRQPPEGVQPIGDQAMPLQAGSFGAATRETTSRENCAQSCQSAGRNPRVLPRASPTLYEM